MGGKLFNSLEGKRLVLFWRGFIPAKKHDRSAKFVPNSTLCYEQLRGITLASLSPITSVGGEIPLRNNHE